MSLQHFRVWREGETEAEGRELVAVSAASAAEAFVAALPDWWESGAHDVRVRTAIDGSGGDALRFQVEGRLMPGLHRHAAADALAGDCAAHAEEVCTMTDHSPADRWDAFFAEHVTCRNCVHATPLLFGFHCRHPESSPRDVSGEGCCECHHFRDPRLRRRFDRLTADVCEWEIASGLYDLPESMPNP